MGLSPHNSFDQSCPVLKPCRIFRRLQRDVGRLNHKRNCLSKKMHRRHWKAAGRGGEANLCKPAGNRHIARGMAGRGHETGQNRYRKLTETQGMATMMESSERQVYVDC
jgi:hypothetical protein